MKTREGFVSNSSSSSFVCCVTGYSHEGYDGQYEVTYACCEHGHEFDGDYALPQDSEEITVEDMRTHLVNDTNDSRLRVAYKHASSEEIRQWFEELHGDNSEYEDYSDLPASACPICTFKYGNSDHLLAYLMQKADTCEEDLLSEIKEKFGTYGPFAKSLDNRMKKR